MKRPKGTKRPKKTIPVASRVTEKMLKALRAEAVRVDRDVSWVIRAACKAYLASDRAAS